MRSTQPNPIGNTVIPSVLQKNLEDLFELAHEHPIRSSVPSAGDGEARDMVIVEDSTGTYIYVKTSRGWFRTAALTAI